ncbi:fused MFS/spermidine synthase [Candidatus Woesearchaeota archaeon]|nr:fused MFS/spermidine synthase [Candidatus Woesearchaeota archaeon]
MKLLENTNQRVIFFSITALGISSIITQVLVMREFLTLFSGNELVFGIILANWLLLTGIGSYLGKYVDRVKHKINLLVIIQILVALLPVAHIFVIRAMRTKFFLAGQLISLGEVFATSLILLLPYCLISGFLLTLFVVVYSKKGGSKQIGIVYFLDNIGDILGGLIFSFILIYLFTHFQSAYFILFLNLLAAIVVSMFFRKRVLYIITGLVVMFSITFLFAVNLDIVSTKMMFKGQELVLQKNSLYGSLVITRSEDQLNFFENGIPLFSTENTVNNEETVHYAMSQIGEAEKVLLVSGGVAGTTNEILKHPVKRVDYVELDPLVIELGKRYTTNLEDDRINLIIMDARLYIKKTKEKYDAVIIDLPDPSTAQINRFYTVEFFKEVKKIIKEDGVASISLSGSENYLNPETQRLNSALYNTLKAVFKNIIIIPGDKNFFIASDKELTYDIAGRLKEKNVSTQYVNEFYLSGKITQERVDYLMNSLIKTSINKDFKPISYYYHLLFWLKHFNTNYIFILILIIILLIILLFHIKPVPFAIFTTGFAASSLEVVILVGFQIIYGFVYHNIGLIITAFMLGLAIGSYYMNTNLGKRKLKNLVRIEFAIAIYAVILPFLLILFSRLAINQVIFSLTQIIIPILTIILAILVGMEFPLAGKLYFKKLAGTAGTLYASDLIGACLGALLVSALLIPLLGLIGVCIVISVLNLISGLVVWRKTG